MPIIAKVRLAPKNEDVWLIANSWNSGWRKQEPPIVSKQRALAFYLEAMTPSAHASLELVPSDLPRV
eukprot:268895-Amphidinium_carterae.1